MLSVSNGEFFADVQPAGIVEPNVPAIPTQTFGIYDVTVLEVTGRASDMRA